MSKIDFFFSFTAGQSGHVLASINASLDDAKREGLFIFRQYHAEAIRFGRESNQLTVYAHDRDGNFARIARLDEKKWTHIDQMHFEDDFDAETTAAIVAALDASDPYITV